MAEIDKFKSLVSEALGYYVYCLVDPRDKNIFYIGKGVGNRVFAHAYDAIKNPESTDKLDHIREILEAIDPETGDNYQVVYYILRHNLKSEEEAFLVESVLIDLLTYPDFNTEKILQNIQGGHHHLDSGILSIKDITAKYYNYDELELQQGDKLLLVNITNSYHKDENTRSLMDSTREFWVVSEDKAKKVDYVLGVYNGIVMEVCKVKGYKYCKCDENGNPMKKERVSFEVEEILDSPYLHKKIPAEFQHVQNPVRYMPNVEDWK